MATTLGRTLALSAAAALVSVLPPPAARAAAASAMPVKNHTLLVRPRGGQLQRIRIAANLDPVAIAADLRKRPDLFSSVGADLIATAADDPTTPAGTPTTPTTPTDPAGTTPTTPPTTDGIVTPSLIPGASTPASKLHGWIPNDHIGSIPWTALQWNFAGTWGVRATQAWQTLRARGSAHAGGRGVKVAIVDSGVAYRTRGVYRESPDLPADRILQGYDFVDDDRFPDDLSGHGTHVASTIAGATGNDAGLTGLAYNADILPVRVLDQDDEGDVVAIARGIRYAARHHADIINLSIDFPVSATEADIPEVMNAIKYARKMGSLVIGSSGNDGKGQLALPARASEVLSVGATTVRGCRSTFSNAGPGLDIVAPGGGTDHRGESGIGCRPGTSGPPISQITLLRANDPSTLGVPTDYIGTSMAAAHLSGVAALVAGSGVLGKHPTADLLAAYLVRTTRDLGPSGRDDHYGAGLTDAAAGVSTRPGSRAAVRGATRAANRAIAAHAEALPTR